MIRQFFYCVLPVIVAAWTRNGFEKEHMQKRPPLLNDSFVEAIVNHSGTLAIRASLMRFSVDPNSRNFHQQYFLYRHSYAPDKPLLFLYVGGSSPMSPLEIPVNLMRLAAAFKAAVAYLEHRYFGGSFPTEDVSAKTLKDLLTIPQAVEDIRTFGEYLKRYLNSPTLQIVLFGDSYGGALAAWAREKYQSLFIGVVSSSSALDAKLENDMYATIEAEDLSNKQLGGSPKCLKTITKAHEDFADLLKSTDGRRKLEDKFKVCRNVLDNRMNQLAFTRDGQLLGISIQDNNPKCRKDYCDISRVCRRLAETKECDRLKDPYFTGEERMSRFIFCRGFGQRQPCTDENNCPWLRTEERLELNVRICGAFGISEEQAKEYVDQVQTEYGGKTLKGATNIFSINGEADPWRSVSITEPAEGIDVYTVPMASHCYWDKNFVKDVCDKTQTIIAKWLLAAW
ncbi:Thymus-specific serine protease [Perkinsus chesapeaki]|uniref:Thymus-specific serine protease n=1 Tax=Perkinsus chesapeaki TaxID=330153 RepID=A0A7J6LMV4_PERCH|nr:Thymus-specific serine protease [Perkinsus chesapeaki]